VEPLQNFAPGGPLVEPSARLRSGALIQQGVPQGLASHGYRHDLAPERAEQRSLEEGTHQLLGALGRARDGDHQRLAPALEAQVPEAQEGQLTSEVLDPNLRSGVLRRVAEAPLHPPPDLVAEPMAEVPARVGSNARQEPKQRIRGNVEAANALLVAELTLREVEHHGAGWIEAGYHDAENERRRRGQYRVLSEYTVKLLETVISRPPGAPEPRRRPRRSTARWLIGCLTVCSWAAAQSTPSTSPRREPSFLLGGPSPRSEPEVPVDPALPSGALRWEVPRPSGTARLCSHRLPVCAHVPLTPTQIDVEPSTLAGAALEALELAYERLVRLEGLPAPGSDGRRGGGGELDWYVGLDEPPPSSAPPESPLTAAGDVAVWLEPQASRGFDRAAAFCVGGATQLSRAAHLCVAEASDAARAPAHPPHVRRAYATHLWWRLGTPELRDELALARLQAAPERGVSWRMRDERSEGAALWFEHLARLGDDTAPPSLRSKAPTAALQLAATRTPAGALRWHGEPDVLDVLRSSLGDSRERVARHWDAFARSRFSVGRPDVDGGWLPWAGEASRVEPAWRLRSSTLPRNLALPRPLTPTGSSYVHLELDRPLPSIALRGTCEAPVSYVWSVTRYDAAWQRVSTLLVPFRERHPVVEQRITELDGVAHLLVTVTNLGGVDLAHPFDPDHEPFEPHACSVYFAAL
jgi:hypothetical protein